MLCGEVRFSRDDDVCRISNLCWPVCNGGVMLETSITFSDAIKDIFDSFYWVPILVHTLNILVDGLLCHVCIGLDDVGDNFIWCALLKLD